MKEVYLRSQAVKSGRKHSVLLIKSSVEAQTAVAWSKRLLEETCNKTSKVPKSSWGENLWRVKTCKNSHAYRGIANTIHRHEKYTQV